MWTCGRRFTHHAGWRTLTHPTLLLEIASKHSRRHCAVQSRPQESLKAAVPCSTGMLIFTLCFLCSVLYYQPSAASMQGGVGQAVLTLLCGLSWLCRTYHLGRSSFFMLQGVASVAATQRAVGRNADSPAASRFEQLIRQVHADSRAAGCAGKACPVVCCDLGLCRAAASSKS